MLVSHSNVKIPVTNLDYGIEQELIKFKKNAYIKYTWEFVYIDESRRRHLTRSRKCRVAIPLLMQSRHAMHVQRNIGARSHNHCCRGKNKY
jgi:hypothetical protein